MGLSVPFGICSVQFSPLNCDGTPDPLEDDIVFCGLTDVGWTKVLTDPVSVSVPGGFPGKICFEYEKSGVVKRYDVTATTCGIYDPRLDAMLGYSDLYVDATNTVKGSMGKPIDSNPDCICACGEEACARRVGLTVWSLNMCPGASSTFHPDGRNMVTVFPGIEWQETTDTVTLNTSVNGKVYTGYSYENPNFGQGPGDIIPADMADQNRPWYQFYSDDCPPGGCDCGACGEDSPAPLVFG